jgi:DNA mismatch endonuclease, patch repair protein
MTRKVTSQVPTSSPRSRVMAAIRSKNTRPERVVRRIAFALGFRFRLHYRKLPGSPDIAFPRLRKVVFVHGCFWHRHTCKLGQKSPRINLAYWQAKFARTLRRDSTNQTAIRSGGWDSLVIWECETHSPDLVEELLRDFLTRSAPVGGKD